MQTSFTGLETAREALEAMQAAMNVTNQNIANSATDGYTRQRVDLTAKNPIASTAQYGESEPAVGQGVVIQKIEQMRDQFLDGRYRDENTGSGYWKGLQDSMSQMESIVSEFDDTTSNKATGLSGDISTLLSDLKGLQGSPDDPNIATTVKNAMSEICQTVNSFSSQLNGLQTQVEGDMRSTVVGSGGGGGINAVLKNIQSLNTQIASYELGGQSANELRDQRNTLLDQLSGYFKISVTEQQNGMVQVGLADDSTHMLVDGNNAVTGFKISSDGKNVQWNDVSSSPATIKSGEVGADLQMINGGSSDNYGIPAMQDNLNTFATEFTRIINKVVTDNNPSGKPLLAATSASDMALSSDWKNNDSLIIKNHTGSTGEGDYVGSFINVITSKSQMNDQGSPYSGTVQDYTDSISMGVAQQLNYVKNEASTAATTAKNINTQRKSVSAVSINEEAINIVKYQQAFNAAGRVVSAISDMLDTLIKSIQ